MMGFKEVMYGKEAEIVKGFSVQWWDLKVVLQQHAAFHLVVLVSNDGI